MLIIRPAIISDVPLLLRFSREFAEYERQPDGVVINEETLVDSPSHAISGHVSAKGV